MPSSSAASCQEAVLLLLWQAIQRLEEEGAVSLTDILAYMASRPFNMKGQEFEELVAHLLDEQLRKLCVGAPFSASIQTTQDKRAADIVFLLDNDRYAFSVKNYSTSRAQIATLAEHLPFFLETFGPAAVIGQPLAPSVQAELLEQVVRRLPEGLTLFALTQDDAQEGLSAWVTSLRTGQFLSTVSRVVPEQTTGKTSHLKFDFYCEGSDHNVFSLALGTNALNRGLWFENGRRHLANDSLTRQIFKVLLHRKKQDIEVWRSLTDRQRMSWLLQLLSEHKSEHQDATA